MKSINYVLIFVLSAVLTVACGGGGGGGATVAVSTSTISNNVIALSAAFAPVAF